ncbi:mannan-binding lectin serine protease 1-like [Antedon mediterranea]|uniref:mannan-binding lectin serine protease 1-like n=1 Tax=Antedon mediterranea TaxID=105859 RepID=UPI003AF59637
MLNIKLYCFVILLIEQVQAWSSSSSIVGSSVESEVDCGVIGPAESKPSDIHSPRYPEKYPRYSDCAWLIRADPDQVILFQFVDIDIEKSEDCPYDAVRIYDGPTKKFPRIVNHCGTNNAPPDFTSSAQHLLVEFESDGSDSGRGFRARYTAKQAAINTDENSSIDEPIEGWTPGVDTDGCSKIIRAINGTVTSPDFPHHYPNDVTCALVVQAPPNYHITLQFKSMDMEDFDCSFDYIEIRDGEFEDSELHGVFCGNRLPETFTSSGEAIRIDFVSDVSTHKLGFEATFTSKKRSRITGEGDGEEEEVDPDLYFKQEPHDVTLVIGEEVRQSCEAMLDGATITWLKDGNELPAGEEVEGIFAFDSGRIIIPSVERKHRGIYTCRIETPDGLSAEKQVYFNFEGESLPTPKAPEIIDFDNKPENGTIFADEDHTFVCRSADATTIGWEKDGVPIEVGSHFVLIFSDLLVIDVTENEEGKYTCYILDSDGERVGESDAWLAIKPEEKISDVCGILNSKEYLESIEEDDRGYIVNGDTSIVGSTPWMARLYHTRVKRFFCGASILNYEWIITAAHCLADKGDFKITRNEDLVIWVGDHDELTMGRDEEKFQVEEIISHENFDQKTFDNDIALIKLSRKIKTFTEYVKPVCLPSKSVVKEISGPGKLVRVMGWGRLEEGAPTTYPRYIQEVTIPLVGKKTCIDATSHEVTVNMICAGHATGQQDACQGDSGGPLVRVTEDGRWQLLGIVSWGEGCGAAGTYGYYAKVIRYRDWISNYVPGVYD